ncbi:MAG TPA: DUF4251 domain-containing protein [Parafilimonas sp.]|nr:DUF4251 domain-containing protein [Parafilimonas sp.]
MKNVLLMLCSAFILCLQTQAQDSTKPTIKTAINAKHFVFKPTTMIPSRGRSRHLDLGYFFKVNGDTLKVYLPYIGRAYSAPIDPSDAGFDFTSTSYNYTVTAGKKKSYEITVKTNDKTSNAEFYLTVYDNGTAYLRTNSPDRESISYNGDIQEK